MLDIYPLDLYIAPPDARCSPTDVDSLKPFVERPGLAPAPGPVLDAGQGGEHEVELLLRRGRLVRGVTRYLVRWRGHASADDEWRRAEELTQCQEKVYDATAPRRRAARPADPAADSEPPPDIFLIYYFYKILGVITLPHIYGIY